MSMVLSAADLDIIANDIAQNQKIAAIKKVRAITGEGLKESKDIVDFSTRPTVEGVRSQLHWEFTRMGYMIDPVGAAKVQAGPTDWPDGTTLRQRAEDSTYAITSKLNMQNELLRQMLEQMKEQTEVLKDLMEVMSE